jgi:hypothetical protein
VDAGVQASYNRRMPRMAAEEATVNDVSIVGPPSPPPGFASGDLALYELQRPLVEPLLQMFRFCNTGLDFLFYDVGPFVAAMLAHGSVIETAERGSSAAESAAPRLVHLDLSALTNPEGSILVVDASRPPYVERFDKMTDFVDYANGPRGNALRTVSITGVGSSALGSAAFAWNASTALGEAVAAIVPGYGLADVVPQALGGWFGFGLHDWVQSATQCFLAFAAPSLAQMGRRLARSSPGHALAATGAPVFPPRQRRVGRSPRRAAARSPHHPRDRPQQGIAGDPERAPLAAACANAKPLSPDLRVRHRRGAQT